MLGDNDIGMGKPVIQLMKETDTENLHPKRELAGLAVINVVYPPPLNDRRWFSRFIGRPLSQKVLHGLK